MQVNRGRRNRYWFGRRFELRFTNLEQQLGELYSADDPVRYESFVVRPVGQVTLQVITDEKDNINRIVAEQGLKEMTQGALIRKLCTYTQPNPTRRAIFEYDKLVRSIYTLRNRHLTEEAQAMDALSRPAPTVIHITSADSILSH